MLAYAVWANDFLQVPIENISLVISYLRNSYFEDEVSIDGYENLHQIIYSETNTMQEFCVDVNKNIPKDKEFFTKCESTVLCSYCNFRELCNR